MGAMRVSVSERVAELEERHARLKRGRFGFLVRPGVILLGALVVLAGIIMIPLPGQGWVTVFLGVALLALEVRWARRLLQWGVRKYEEISHWYFQQSVVVKRSLTVAVMAIASVVAAATLWWLWVHGGSRYWFAVMGHRNFALVV